MTEAKVLEVVEKWNNQAKANGAKYLVREVAVDQVAAMTSESALNNSACSLVQTREEVLLMLETFAADRTEMVCRPAGSIATSLMHRSMLWLRVVYSDLAVGCLAPD